MSDEKDRPVNHPKAKEITANHAAAIERLQISLPEEDHQEFWAALRSGSPPSDAQLNAMEAHLQEATKFWSPRTQGLDGWPRVRAQLTEALKQQARAKPARVARPPASSLLAAARFLYSRKHYREIFEPMVADFQAECFEALADGRVHHVRWRRAVFTVQFVHAMLFDAGSTFLKLFIQAFRAKS